MNSEVQENKEIDLNLLQMRLKKSQSRFGSLMNLEMDLSIRNPSDLMEYLTILKSKLESMKNREQSLGCPAGLASKTKEAILSGVEAESIFSSVVDSLELLQNRNMDFSSFINEDIRRLGEVAEEMKQEFTLINKIMSNME